MCDRDGAELILQAAGKYGQTVGGLAYTDVKMLPPLGPITKVTTNGHPWGVEIGGFECNGLWVLKKSP